MSQKKYLTNNSKCVTLVIVGNTPTKKEREMGTMGYRYKVYIGNADDQKIHAHTGEIRYAMTYIEEKLGKQWDKYPTVTHATIWEKTPEGYAVIREIKY